MPGGTLFVQIQSAEGCPEKCSNLWCVKPAENLNPAELFGLLNISKKTDKLYSHCSDPKQRAKEGNQSSNPLNIKVHISSLF